MVPSKKKTEKNSNTQKDDRRHVRLWAFRPWTHLGSISCASSSHEWKIWEIDIALRDCCVKQLKMPRYLARINVDCAMDSSSYSSVLFFVLSDYPANGLDHHQRVSTSDDDFDAWATKDSFSSTPTLLPLAECIIPRPYSLFHYTDTQKNDRQRSQRVQASAVADYIISSRFPFSHWNM